MKTYFGIILLLLVAGGVNAQDLLKGTVYEAGTNNKLTNVFIKDNNNRQLTLTDDNGKFELRTETGHILVFYSPGYRSDTLYVTDLNNKHVELKAMTIALHEVNINSKRETFNPRVEYPEVYTKSKVYVLAPSTWFSKEGKDARRLRRFFTNEEQESHVDEVYTAAYVGSIIPLKGKELDNFMSLYRPSYAFLRNNNGPSLAAYVNDSYKRYMALPPDKRVNSLTGQ